MPKNHLTPSSNEDDSLRPIGARALKSAIDTLRPRLHGASVLDLYAGQGRFGCAASLEGISSICFVEKNRKIAEQIRTISETRQFPKTVSSKIIVSDALQFLKTAPPLIFDIVFADPPFNLWNLAFENELLTLALGVLSPSSIFLVKHPTRVIPCSQIKGLKLIKTTIFGESRLQYFEYGENQSSE